MTQELKDKIRSLRLIGVGYGSIAKQLNIPEDTVKTHCRRNGLAGRVALTHGRPAKLPKNPTPAPPPKKTITVPENVTFTVICTFPDISEEALQKDFLRTLMSRKYHKKTT